MGFHGNAIFATVFYCIQFEPDWKILDSKIFKIFSKNFSSCLFKIFSWFIFLKCQIWIFRMVSQMLNTVVKKLFAFNCAIYSVTYIFYSLFQFSPNFATILPNFCQVLPTLSIGISWKIHGSWLNKFNKEKSKEGENNELLYQQRTDKEKFDFPKYEHNIFIISGTFSCPFDMDHIFLCR